MSEAAAVLPVMLRKPVVSADGPVQSIPLVLVVSDHDSVDELLQKAEGRERDQFALTTLRIGVLAMKHARGQLDADAVRRRGERLLVD